MKIVLGFLFGGEDYKSISANFGVLLGRLGFGLLLFFLHGMGKLQQPDALVGMVQGLGFPAPALFAWLLALAEGAGSLMVAVGFMTRPAALSVAIAMAVAALMAHGADPLAKKELALLYLAFALIFLFTGAGNYSVDGLVYRKRD